MQQSRLAGMYRMARRQGWCLHEIDLGIPDADLKRTLEFWQPVGCMVEGGLARVGSFLPSDSATGTLRFTADVAADPTNATYLYEIVRD